MSYDETKQKMRDAEFAVKVAAAVVEGIRRGEALERKPVIGPYTAMRHPELFVKCSGNDSHDMKPYRIWWCLWTAWGERCTRCNYKNPFAYD